MLKIQTAKVLLVVLLACRSTGTVVPYGGCSASQYYSNVQLSCQECLNSSHLVPLAGSNRCICQPGYKKTNESNVNWNQVCTTISGTTPPTCLNSNQVLLDIDESGAYLTTALTCKACQSPYIANQNQTRCIWCGPNTLSASNGCSCIAGFTQGAQGCYNISQLGLNTTGTIYNTIITKAAAGCLSSSQRDQQSCSLLMNLCLFSLMDTSSTGTVCSLLKKQSLLYMSDINQYRVEPTLNPSETNKVYALAMRVLKYFPNGSLAAESALRLGDLMLCQLPNTTITFKVGNNFKHSCAFNLNNVLNLLASSRYVSYLYQLFVADPIGAYYQVPVYINAGPDPVGRFFLQDTYSLPNSSKLTYAQSLTLDFTLTSDTYLTKPKLSISYSQLAVNAVTGTLVNSLQTVTTELSFSYELTNFDSVLVPIFIVVNVLVLLQVSIRTYAAYRNRKSVLLFLPYFLQTWSTYMFFLLLIFSGYFFFFTKATAQIYVLMPKASTFYLNFYLILGLMVLGRVVSDFIEKQDIISSEIYIIDWEASPQRNSWRSMFIVNSLAEFYSYRTISFFWVVAWAVFLLTGLSWELHSRQTTSLTQSSISTLNPVNPVLMYFLCSSIFLVVGMLMKFLRRMLVIWWPYPFEDFLDYCSLANISLFFCKRNAPIGYYLYATNADRSELTFKEINDQIAKGSLRKRRDFLADPIAESDDCQTFTVYLQSDFESKLNQLRRTEDLTELEPLNRKGKKAPFNVREEFVERYLKKLLNAVPQQRNQLVQPTLLQSCIGLPPIDLTEPRELPTFIPSRDYQSTDLFPNSSEVHELLSFAMLFTLFSVITQSTAVGAFLSYFIFQVLYQWWIAKQTRKSIERFTKIKQGFML